MKAMILAAGLGTRLRPWTLEHPKALVPVGGVPMLERVIFRLKGEGFNEIIINVHHFSNQIIDFVRSRDFGVDIKISDESESLLDTGGGLVKASRYFTNEPVLIHNVDILSNADLRGLMASHVNSKMACSLLVSERMSSRKLIFDSDLILKGWHHIEKEEYKPLGLSFEASDKEYSFSGIYVASPQMCNEMKGMFGNDGFPIMDYFLSPDRKETIRGVVASELRLLDIGKPDTLNDAQSWL